MNTTLKIVIVTSALMASACGDYFTNRGDPPEGKYEPRNPTSTQNVTLKSLAVFSGIQVSGVTISSSGRIFASFPRWREGVPFSVVEVNSDGSWTPYPDANWNTWSGQPRNGGFTCVQSVFAHKDSLFVLDPSSPMLKGVVGQAALYEFDLRTNTLKNSWRFDSQIAPGRSYLNDLRIDDDRGFAYITDSALGAIVALDMNSGVARRLLEESPSTKSDQMTLFTSGKPLLKSSGRPMRTHANGIALKDGYLYYHSITGRKLFRIATDALANTSISSLALSRLVEDLGTTPSPDGMEFDNDGNLFMADLERNAIVYRTPKGEIRTFVRDPGLKWVDSIAITPANELVFTDSRVNLAPPGASVSGMTFNIYKVALQ